MNLIIILFVSLLVLIALRYFFIGLYYAISKLLKLSGNNVKFDLVLSISFFCIYLEAFLGAVGGVLKGHSLSNLEWYFVYTCMGIASMFWCYFSWDLRLKAMPKFGANDKQTIVKKIVVFLFVMIFSFCYGYENANKIFMGEDVDALIALTNVTIIPGIIALDRVFNQIANWKKLN